MNQSSLLSAVTAMTDFKAEVTRDGQVTDITEGVKVIWDALVQSLDFGSGFLDREELDDIRVIQEACGFPADLDAVHEGLEPKQSEAKPRTKDDPPPFGYEIVGGPLDGFTHENDPDRGYTFPYFRPDQNFTS